MSTGLLLAVATALLGVAFALAGVVVVGVVGWLLLGRSERSAPKPRPARAGATSKPPPPSGPPRGPRTVTEERPRAPAPPPAQSPTAGPLQPGPMIGFFDDETSTGAALQQARQSSLSTAFLNTLPPTKLEPPKRPIDDDDPGEGEATEIFSANTLSSDLAALLEEPDLVTPPPKGRRGP